MGESRPSHSEPPARSLPRTRARVSAADIANSSYPRVYKPMSVDNLSAFPFGRNPGAVAARTHGRKRPPALPAAPCIRALGLTHRTEGRARAYLPVTFVRLPLEGNFWFGARIEVETQPALGRLRSVHLQYEDAGTPAVGIDVRHAPPGGRIPRGAGNASRGPKPAGGSGSAWRTAPAQDVGRSSGSRQSNKIRTFPLATTTIGHRAGSRRYRGPGIDGTTGPPWGLPEEPP